MSDHRLSCRSCGATDLMNILSLGSTPLANALLTAKQLGEPEPIYPLEFVFCIQCALVQITETVPPEQLFKEYLYFSSFSETMLEHARQLVDTTIEDRFLSSESLVVEIASNDGYLLQYYRLHDVSVLGIEPATNIARVAQEQRGIPTLCEFFDSELAMRLYQQGKRADVIHANNVLAHVADLNGFVEGISILLKDGGVAIIEVPYVKDLVDNVEFDTIYHEHLCYFSLTSLSRLFQRHQLRIQGVQRLPIHGGSLRVFAGKDNGRVQGGDRWATHVQGLLDEEEAWGVDDPGFYQGFGARVASLRADLLKLMTGLKAEGKRIAAYGASAKGSTMLNYFGIGRDMLDFVVDRSTVKQGLYTPGTHLPIHAPEKLHIEMPDYVLLLTWNFAQEILSQQAEYRRRGGRFIIPVPDVRIV